MARSKKDQYDRIIKSNALDDGPRSATGSIRPEKLSAIINRMEADDVEASEHAVRSWLGRFKLRYGENFYTRDEIEQNIQRARSEANAPRKPADDVTRDTLKSMSAIERLEFANAREPQKPVVLSIDADENFTEGDE
ncbi:MAG TPA: hypothetical protein VIJ62_15060 [Rhizomicrobium sp.]